MSLLYPKPTTTSSDKKAKARAKDLAWRRLRQVVLTRDGRRCRVCKTAEGVDVHHIRFRSVGGKDYTSNIAALCRCCHGEIHAYRLTLAGDANGTLRIQRSA